MSTTTTFTPKTHSQNGSVKVEAVQMMNENVDEIVKWIGKNVEVHRTKTHMKDITIITVDVPGYAGVQHLRYKDFLVKYTNGKDVSFLVLSAAQFHQRYESSTPASTTSTSYTYNYNPWGFGDRD